jgi:hypothetical protein
MITGWTWYGTYPEACALVMGYLEGRGGGPMIAEFQEWFVARYGGSTEVVFWHGVLQLALPGATRADDVSPAENAAAVDKLFEVLIDWLEDSNDPDQSPSG